MIEALSDTWTVDSWAALAVLSLAAWVYLLGFRGGFWRGRPLLDLEAPAAGEPVAPAPRVVAVMPARNEAELVGRSLRSLLAQDYPGPFSVVLVDDRSEDGTAEAARGAAAGLGGGDRLEVVTAAPLPPGWTGKMWAVSQGVARAEALFPDAAYLWLTDADIAHHPGELGALVARAEGGGPDLVSVMALLRCRSPWERLLVPAFIFFFQMVYPFPWVNDPGRGTAGAAGGSMLVRRRALARAGGIEAVRGALIDDCALAREIKRGGAVWLGLVRGTASLRPYPRLGAIWAMVARSAYTQLHHSPVLLAASLVGMCLAFLAPPVAAVAGALGGRPAVAVPGALAWLAMAFAYLPTLRLYRRPPPAALLLPAATLLYCAMTLDSAWRHWRGRGGGWKGRTYAPHPGGVGSGGIGSGGAGSGGAGARGGPGEDAAAGPERRGPRGTAG